MIDNDEYNDIYTGDPKNNPLDAYMEGFTYNDYLAERKRIFEELDKGTNYKLIKNTEQFETYGSWIHEPISRVEEAEAFTILRDITTAAFIEYGKKNDTNKWPHYNIRDYIGLSKEQLSIDYIPNREEFYTMVFGKPAREGIEYVLGIIEDAGKYLDNSERARAILSKLVKEEYPNALQIEKEKRELYDWHDKMADMDPGVITPIKRKEIKDLEDYLTYFGTFVIGVLKEEEYRNKNEFTEEQIIRAFKVEQEFLAEELERIRNLKRINEEYQALKKPYKNVIDYINEIYPPLNPAIRGEHLSHNVSVFEILEKLIAEGLEPGYSATKEDLEHWKEIIKDQIIEDFGSLEQYEKIKSLMLSTFEDYQAPKKKERRRKTPINYPSPSYITAGVDCFNRSLPDAHTFKEGDKTSLKEGYVPPLEAFLVAEEKRTFNRDDKLELYYDMVIDAAGNRRKISPAMIGLLEFISSLLKRNTPPNEHKEGSDKYRQVSITDYQLIHDWMGTKNVDKHREAVHDMLLFALRSLFNVNIDELLEKDKPKGKPSNQSRKKGGYRQLLIFKWDEEIGEDGKVFRRYYFEIQPYNTYIADILHQTITYNNDLTHPPRLSIKELQERGDYLQRHPPVTKIGEEDAKELYAFKSKEETDRAIKIIEKYAGKYDLWGTGEDTDSLSIRSSVKNMGIMSWVSKEVAYKRRKYCAGEDGEVILKASEIYEKLWDQSESRKDAKSNEQDNDKGPSRKEKETLIKTVERFLIYLMIEEKETGVYDFKEKRGRGKTAALEDIVIKVRKQPNPQRLH